MTIINEQNMALDAKKLYVEERGVGVATTVVTRNKGVIA